MFYMAEAILLGKGLSFSSHSAVHAAFGTHFAKTGLVTPELHRFLLDAFDIRGKSDYEIAGTVSESEAAEQIAHAEQFVDAVQHFLEG